MKNYGIKSLLIVFFIIRTIVCAQSDSSKIKFKIHELKNKDPIYKQITLTKKIVDTLFQQLIPGSNKIRFDLLLNRLTKRYLILGLEFLDDSSKKIASTSVIKLSDIENDGYFIADSSKIVSRIIDSLAKEIGSNNLIPKPKNNDTIKFIKTNTHHKINSGKNKTTVRRKPQIEIHPYKSYNYQSEKLVGKYFTDGKSFTFQHSSWKNKNKAKVIVDKLLSKGIKAFFYAIEPKKGMGIWYRVRIGPYKKRGELSNVMKKLKM
jgi:hypothetical protein